jgi:hypothetical protein
VCAIVQALQQVPANQWDAEAAPVEGFDEHDPTVIVPDQVVQCELYSGDEASGVGGSVGGEDGVTEEEVDGPAAKRAKTEA